jgi:hypothetical protein
VRGNGPKSAQPGSYYGSTPDFDVLAGLTKRALGMTVSVPADALGIAERPVSTGPRRACQLVVLLARWNSG